MPSFVTSRLSVVAAPEVEVEAETDVDAKRVASTDHVLGQYIPLLYHYNMLQDEDRVGAFREAIELVVQPGMHVVELGGGTGILSSFAARRGARVSCVERDPELVERAKHFVSLNGLDDRITVIQSDATDFVPDSPVDAVVCEMLHVGLLREKQAEVITAFKKNYTKTFGPTLPMFLPEASILMAGPVSHSYEFSGYTAPVPMFQAPLLEQPRTRELASLSPYANIAYEATIPLQYRIRQSVTANCTGECNAIRFVTQNVIAVDIRGQRAITWPNQCLVLPLDRAVGVTEGSEIEMIFDYRAGDAVEKLASSIRVSTLR